MKKILAAILFCFFCLGVMGFSACMSSKRRERPISSSEEESSIPDSSPGEHEYGELIAEKPATCEEEGVKAHYHCDRCGKDFDEDKQLLEDLVIPALGHEYGELIAEIPATCEGEGVKAHYHCDHCGKDFDEAKQLLEDLVIPALGHDYGELIAEIPVTCEEDGVKVHYHCDRCGKNFDEEKQLLEDLVIPASGHDYGELIAEIPATCEEGVKAHYHCNICGNDFDEAKQLIEDLVIPALGHDWDEPEYNFAEDGSTCTAERVCKRNAAHKETATATISHEVTKESTCTEKGETTYTAVFEEDWAEDQILKVEDIAELGHNYGELIAETPATCEEEGVKAHYHCDRCGKDFDEAKQPLEDLVIPALGHDWGKPEYHFAEDGKSCTAERVCKRNAAHKETATATVSHEVTKEATCTEKGEMTYTAVFKEDWAEEQILKVEDIAELGHNYGEWIAEIPATATEPGTSGHYHCDRCGQDFNALYNILEDLVIPAGSQAVIPEVGETMIFGNYHEATEWIVLAKDEDKTFIIAKDIIDLKPYNTEFADITWENCTLRAWLNNEYINTVFTEEEKSRILTTHLVNNDNTNEDPPIPGGNDTDDKVFLLSIEEVNTYLVDDAARMAKGTDHANGNGLYVYHEDGSALDGYSNWWLRSPGDDSRSAIHVHYDGCFYDGAYVNDAVGVRPALWIWNHCPDEGVITKQPTCTEMGLKIYTCTVCGKTRTEEIPVLGHNLSEWIAEVPATATEPGTKGHYHCSRCNKDFDKDKQLLEDLVIPAGSQAVIPEVGATMIFGNYHGATEWIVLEKNEEKALIITKDIIDSIPYNEESVDITWENCTLRAWLNNEYINEAFSAEEKNRILTTHVVNNDNTIYDPPTLGGNDTDDKVFLLSIEEAGTYFANGKERQAQGTQYAKDNGLYVYTGTDYPQWCGYSYWWLRSPGYDPDIASAVVPGGMIGDACYLPIYESVCGVRPALWISNQ